MASDAQDPGLIPSTEKKKSVFPNSIFHLPKLVLVGKVTSFKVIPNGKIMVSRIGMWGLERWLSG